MERSPKPIGSGTSSLEVAELAPPIDCPPPGRNGVDSSEKNELHWESRPHPKPRPEVAPEAERRRSSSSLGARPGLSETPFERPDAYLRRRLSTFDSQGLRRTESGGALAHRPFRIHPDTLKEGPWMREEDRATELLSLFFDLVVVAVLTVFSNTHKIQSAGSIPVFLSYYVVITWIWTSQVHYDARYEAEDTYHRLAKCLQMIVFVYCGAASGGWNPGKVVKPDRLTGLDESEQVAYQQAVESFLTVTIAYAIYRALLLLQYLIIIFDGRRSGNKVYGAATSAITLCISCVIGIIAIVIPPTSYSRGHAKIAMFYLSIGLEITGAWYQLSTGIMGEVRSEYMAGRYAAQTLIILGEGFVNLVTAFSNAISGLSVSSASAYAQVFLVILIMYYIWSFLFSAAGKQRGFAPRRTLVWEFIHFPLHFGILLLVAAMVNVVLIGTFSTSMGKASDTFETVLEAFANGTTLDNHTLRHTSIYLNRLGIVPGFMEAYTTLQWSFNQTANETAESGIDPLTMSLQYYGQIVTAVAAKSGIVIQSGPASELASLAGIGAYLGKFDQETFEQSIDWFQDNLATIMDDAYAGTYWLYPCAGGVLILCALRSMIRYEAPTRKHLAANGFSCAMGLGLALLGLLAIGGHKVRIDDEGDIVASNPMTRLVESSWSLAVVVFAFTLVAVGYHAIPWLIERGDKDPKNDTVRKPERPRTNGDG